MTTYLMTNLPDNDILLTMLTIADESQCVVSLSNFLSFIMNHIKALIFYISVDKSGGISIIYICFHHCILSKFSILIHLSITLCFNW